MSVSGARMESFTMSLPAEASTPQAARRAVAAWLGPHPRQPDLLLCVSEVVTNAVLHARSPQEMTVSRDGDLLTVEVLDGDTGLPTERDRDPAASTGRGLQILGDLSVRWGVRSTPAGKSVWFELDLADPAPLPSAGPTSPPPPSIAAAVVEISEDLDLGSAPRARDRILEAHAGGATTVHVDLSNCEFIDSTGLSLLLTTQLRLAARGGTLHLVGVHGAVASVLEMAGVTHLLVAPDGRG